MDEKIFSHFEFLSYAHSALTEVNVLVSAAYENEDRLLWDPSKIEDPAGIVSGQNKR